MTSSALFNTLSLPNGRVLPNRIAKAAMEENMATHELTPSDQLIRLYEAWAKGGSGMLISGNVMVDRTAMTGPAGVVLENDEHLDRFRLWAKAGKQGGALFLLQISHPGRQMPAALGQETVAPSAVAMDLGMLSSQFPKPRPMTESDIQAVIQRFANTARLAEQAGFDGVEIHGAHGYLVSQFLSPVSNQRQDQWGGSLENRARLLLEIVRRIRSQVSAGFTVGVKLNSADFQRGGFSAEDAAQVLQMLNQEAIDFVELSGGSYEAPAMMGSARDGRTLAREAYFLEFAQQLKTVAKMPLMVTGGIRRKPVAEQVLAGGVDLVGIATALAVEPALPALWKAGENTAPALAPMQWSNKALASTALMSVVKHQLERVSQGRKTQPSISPVWALIVDQVKAALLARRYRRHMSRRARAA